MSLRAQNHLIPVPILAVRERLGLVQTAAILMFMPKDHSEQGSYIFPVVPQEYINRRNVISKVAAVIRVPYRIAFRIRTNYDPPVDRVVQKL